MVRSSRGLGDFCACGTVSQGKERHKENTSTKGLEEEGQNHLTD